MLLAVWAMLTIAVLVLMVVADLNRARSQLDQLGSSLLQHVSDRSLVSETALEAFAAYVASLDRFDHERARSFARSLLGRYPFLYMFELAVRVDATERAGVERRLAGRYPGFEIRQFTYQADRRWQTAEPAEFYYPLVFQEPLLDGPANVIGLDIYANELLRQAMATSFMRGQPVTTHPFDLAEGGRGYVLHRSVDNLGGRPPSAFEAREYALLALKTADLIPAPR